jgi:hypothetical protein
MKQIYLKYFLLLPFYLIFVISGCKYLPLPISKEQLDAPRGTSTMTAKINGVPKMFSSIVPSDYYGSKEIRGSCESNRIDLQFGRSVGGWCTWSANQYERGIVSYDTTAYLNYLRAIPGIGGFEIKTINKAMREYSGIFEFSVFDTLSNDTIRITEGNYDVFCPSQD